MKIYTRLIASTDLWPQEMFTFWKCLQMVVSETSVDACVCHGRPAGLRAQFVPLVNAKNYWKFWKLSEEETPSASYPERLCSFKIFLELAGATFVRVWGNSTTVPVFMGAVYHQPRIISAEQNVPNPTIEPSFCGGRFGSFLPRVIIVVARRCDHSSNPAVHIFS